MGRFYLREDPLVVDRLVKEGKVHLIDPAYEGVIEVCPFVYTLGIIDDALLAGKLTRRSHLENMTDLHRQQMDAGNPNCWREFNISFINGVYVPEFMPQNLKKFVVFQGERPKSLYEHWKTPYRPRDPDLAARLQ